MIDFGVGLFMFGAALLQAHAANEPCPQRGAVEAIVRDHLPAFDLASPAPNAGDPCSKVVSADFNGDGSLDYAAVLTEKVAPRKYSDDSARFTSYVFVFLAARLPYAEYEAALLLGHSSAPKRITLEAIPSASKGAAQLVVKNARYSRTVYEWAPTGFVVRDHEAD